MRYIVNSENRVLAVSFGAMLNYADCDCTEYTGITPSGWNNLEEWYEDEGEKLWRWKIVGKNLVYDASAIAPEEGEWGIPELQNKTVSGMILGQMVVTPDEGFDGLSSVTIEAQPGWKFCDESNVMVAPDESVLYVNTGTNSMPKVIMVTCTRSTIADSYVVRSMWIELTDNSVTAGEAYLNVNGTPYRFTSFSSIAVARNGGTLSISIPGTTFYYSSSAVYYKCFVMYGDTGSTESLNSQAKTVTPTKSKQIILPDEGYSYLSSVTIEAIPGEYIVTDNATATAEDIAKGETAYANGVKLTGTHTDPTITQTGGTLSIK